MSIFRNLVLGSVGLCLIVGCDRGPTLVPASGKLTVRGEPMGGISLTFMPDVKKGNAGPTSYGSTDQDGKFELFSQGGEPGAVVGAHVVTLVDEEEERPAQGETAKPPRISTNYSMASNGVEVTIVEGESTEVVIP